MTSSGLKRSVPEEAISYRGLSFQPEAETPFHRARRTYGVRWDGLLVDTVLRACDINTVSFLHPSTALAILQANRKVRRYSRPRPGDVVFLERDSLVGIILTVETRHRFQALVGYMPENEHKRSVRVLTLNARRDVLAVANPDLGIVMREDDDRLPLSTTTGITRALSNHPAVGAYVDPRDVTPAYARFQRYCGYTVDKVTGRPDLKSLDRLSRESK